MIATYSYYVGVRKFVAECLLYWIQAHHYDTEFIAREIGIPKNALDRFLQGKWAPNADLFLKIIDKCGLSFKLHNKSDGNFDVFTDYVKFYPVNDTEQV